MICVKFGCCKNEEPFSVEFVCLVHEGDCSVFFKCVAFGVLGIMIAMAWSQVAGRRGVR